MSSNNKLFITKDFKIYNTDVDTGSSYVIGQGKDAKDALRIAQEFCDENGCEYGINTNDLIITLNKRIL